MNKEAILAAAVAQADLPRRVWLYQAIHAVASATWMAEGAYWTLKFGEWAPFETGIYLEPQRRSVRSVLGMRVAHTAEADSRHPLISRVPAFRNDRGSRRLGALFDPFDSDAVTTVTAIVRAFESILAVLPDRMSDRDLSRAAGAVWKNLDSWWYVRGVHRTHLVRPKRGPECNKRSPPTPPSRSGRQKRSRRFGNR